MLAQVCQDIEPRLSDGTVDTCSAPQLQPHGFPRRSVIDHHTEGLLNFQ